jgi:hypothetical protein
MADQFYSSAWLFGIIGQANIVDIVYWYHVFVYVLI